MKHDGLTLLINLLMEHSGSLVVMYFCLICYIQNIGLECISISYIRLESRGMILTLTEFSILQWDEGIDVPEQKKKVMHF